MVSSSSTGYGIWKWRPIGRSFRWQKYRGYNRRQDAQKRAMLYGQSGAYLVRIKKEKSQWVIYLRKKSTTAKRFYE
jgi:hypothetical protein